MLLAAEKVWVTSAEHRAGVEPEKSLVLLLLLTPPTTNSPSYSLPGAAVLPEMGSLILCIPLCPQNPRWCLPRSSRHALKCRPWRGRVPR